MNSSRRLIGQCLLTAFLGLLAFIPFANGAVAEVLSGQPLRVQLLWKHQSEFAGYYVADSENYFREEGVAVTLLEGGNNIDPLERLRRGEVDVAIAWLDNALTANDHGAHLVNVAQIFAGSSQEVICRVSQGIHSIRDLAGKAIGVNWKGDKDNIRAMLREAGVDASGVQWVPRAEHGEDLVNGTVPCITGVSYNEPMWVVDAGVPASDLMTFSPADYGLPHPEDGIYVREESLKSPAFRDAVVRFIRASKRGWAYAQAEPAPTTNIVLRYARPTSTTWAYQKGMLDKLLHNIPKNLNEFGVINIGDYDRYVKSVEMMSVNDYLAHPIWTMSLVEAAKAGGHHAGVLTDSTLQYLRMMMASGIFRAFVYAGIWIFGFAGGLWATESGYNFVGRFVIGAIGCMGGGILRDILLGGDRLPFPWLVDPVLPLGVFVSVLAAGLLVEVLPMGTHSKTFEWTQAIAEDIGYACLATFGAVVPLSLNLPWIWAPFCAWLTCCGGSLVRDVITGREPASFRAKLFDECTFVGGFWIVGCLMVANYFEHARWLAPLTIGTTIVLVGAVRHFWRHNDVWYPRWLHHRAA